MPLCPGLQSIHPHIKHIRVIFIKHSPPPSATPPTPCPTFPSAIRTITTEMTPHATIYLYVQVSISGSPQHMLVPRMLHQIPVRDHTFLLRRYTRCFSSLDAINFFISKRYARTQTEALALGNALLKAGVFRHVRNEHLFRNGTYFYRFAAHEPYLADEHAPNLRSSRMMSVACNSFLHIPEFTRVHTRTCADSDATMFSCDDPAPVSAGAAFVEEDVNVETGIRIGAKFFPHLVSTFTHATDLVARHVASNGRSFEKAFSGRQAVMWLRKYQYASTQVEAVGIGNAMLSAGVFHPLESDHGGFECKDVYYRMVADMDISKELKRGARKDVFLKLLGFDRAKSVGCVQALQSPWFEDQVSFSFTSATSGGSAVR